MTTTFIILPGACGISECTEQHAVTPLSEPLWFGPDGTPVVQYRGRHHGQWFIYEQWMVRVNLAKDPSVIRWAQVRTPEAGTDCRDLYTHESCIAPLWWDDSSYIRYQSDDGPTGFWKFTLRRGVNLRKDASPAIVRRWVDFEYELADA